MRFDLALESGPRRRKTMIHVLTLPGCIAIGPTTDEAIENARQAIRDRLAFLRRHGEHIDDPEPIEVEVVEQDLSGDWLGFAVTFFEADRQPLTEDEVERDLRWLGWSREELADAARRQPAGLTGEPAERGRSAAAILAHVAGAEQARLASMLGSSRELNDAAAAVERNPTDPWQPLARERAIVVERLAAMTEEERTRVVETGKQPRSARRMLRRMLEHEWEHVLELQARLPDARA